MGTTTMRAAITALALAALITPSSVVAAPLVREPYLQMAAPDAVTIVWMTAEASSGAVEYGMSTDALTTVVASEVPVTQHEVRLTGLQADTTYFYRVRSDGRIEAGGDDSYRFVTPPPVGTPKKFRLWAAGDTGAGTEGQRDVFAAMLSATARSRPNFGIHLGDIAYSGGSEPEFTERYFAVYEGLLRNTVVWPTLGNAEGIDSDSATQTGPYYDAFVLPDAAQVGGTPSGSEAYYAFDYANVHFVVLDSFESPREPNGPMLQWVREDLNATTQDWAIAYWHHPPFANGSHNSDLEAILVEMRENALPILESAGVDLVLAGHSHAYERTFLLDAAYATPSVAGQGVVDPSDGRIFGDGPLVKAPGLTSHGGTVYVVAGHGGAGVSLSDNHVLTVFGEGERGSCIIDVQDNRLTLTNVREDGEITDRMDMVKGDAIVLGQPNGGEHLVPGTVYDVGWRTVGDLESVRIELSTDGGARWSTVEASTPDTGEYQWLVPETLSDQVLLRVSDAMAGGVLTDESNGVFSVGPPSVQGVIAFGDTWRYHDQGEDLGLSWLTADYDDTAWMEGPAHLGYGDGDEATTVRNAPPGGPTVYVRKVVQLTEKPVRAELSVLFDDGVIVWVNGQEVFSDNTYSTSHDSYATTRWVHDNEVRTTDIDPFPFVVGDNVVAAVIKSSSPSSDDLSFDLALSVLAEQGPPPPSDDTGSDGTAGDSQGTSNGTNSSTGVASAASGVATMGTAANPDAITDLGSRCACRQRSGERWPAMTWLALLLLARRRRPSVNSGFLVNRR